MQEMHSSEPQTRSLLTARQVQLILHVDRSTVYRMAEDGRLPAIRVGKQWRFPEAEILALVAAGGLDDETAVPGSGSDQAIPVQVASAAVQVAAELLGVMMVVTDMEGHPVTPIANPCDWFTHHGQESAVMAACVAEWRDLAEDHDFTPRFQVGSAGFECARAFIRTGRELTGMVLAGGVCPAGSEIDDLYDLDEEHRAEVLAALPRIAGVLSQHASTPVGAPSEDTR